MTVLTDYFGLKNELRFLESESSHGEKNWIR